MEETLVRNIDCFGDEDVVKIYDKMSELFPAEKEILNLIAKNYKDKKILDVGVGAGRTTTALTNISKEYLGIDYSETMVKNSRLKYPNQKFIVSDMRDLVEQFQPSSFDVVVVSFNGIDYVNHDDRLKTLRGIYSLLKPGGAFCFSTHNLEYGLRHRGFRFGFTPSLNPAKIAIRALRSLIFATKALPNYLTRRKFESVSNGFALLNDWAHNYRLLTYYASEEEVTDQLRTVGFNNQLNIYHPFKPHSRDFTDVSWIYYFTVK